MERHWDRVLVPEEASSICALCYLHGPFWATFTESFWVIFLWLTPHDWHPLPLLGSLRGSVIIWTSRSERRWGCWCGGGHREWAAEMGNRVSAFQGFPGENRHSELADSQGWQARGPRLLRPLKTPVQGGPAAAAMALVRAEARTALLSATSAWTQPRMPSSACVATSSGQYPFHSSGEHMPNLKSLWPWTALQHFGSWYTQAQRQETWVLIPACCW